jgi:FMN reductase
MRPLFAYLGAATVPTGIYAASADWGVGGVSADGGLANRIDRAAAELAVAMTARPRRPAVDRFRDPVPFEDLLRSSAPED